MTATTSEIVTHLILDWIGFLIPAYVAFRVARYLVGCRWPTVDRNPGKNLGSQDLYQVDGPEFSILDYPNRMLTIIFCRLEALPVSPRLRLSYFGMTRFNFVALIGVGIFLAISLGAVAVACTSIVLLSTENFRNFPEFYEEYARIPVFLLDLSLKFQLLLCLILLAAGLISLHSAKFLATLGDAIAWSKRHNPPIIAETRYGPATRPTVGFFNYLTAASLPVISFLMLTFLLPEMAHPTIRRPEEVWQLHFMWPTVFVLFSFCTSLTLFLPGLLLQRLVGILIMKIQE